VPKPEMTTSLDYVVGNRDQLIRNLKTERFSGSEVNRKVELDRLLNGQITRFCASIYGMDAKGSVFAADCVLHVFFALFAPLLDRIHVRKLKEDDTVGRLCTCEAQGLVIASGQILATVLRAIEALYAQAKSPAFVVVEPRANNDSRIISRSALAALRLMTSSNWVGCSTGMSPGFVNVPTTM